MNWLPSYQRPTKNSQMFFSKIFEVTVKLGQINTFYLEVPTMHSIFLTIALSP